MTTDATTAEPIDREALRARYRAERDKRLRPDGNDQYLEPTGRFAHFLDDPYVEPGRARAAVRRGHRRRSSAAASPGWSPAPG